MGVNNFNLNLDYLNNLKKFWDVDDFESAMFDKIVVTRQVRRMSLQDKYRFWEEFTKKSMEYLLKDVPVTSNWDILEIGCGIGRLMLKFSKLVKFVSGVDISEKMILYSKEYLKDVVNCKTYLGNGYDLSELESGRFDFIYSYITFQHIKSFSVVKSYLSEIYRTLKSGGYFKFQVHRYKPEYGFSSYDYESVGEAGFAGNAYTEDQLKFLLDKFKILDIYKEESEFDHIWVLVKK